MSTKITIHISHRQRSSSAPGTARTAPWLAARGSWGSDAGLQQKRVGAATTWGRPAVVGVSLAPGSLGVASGGRGRRRRHRVRANPSKEGNGDEGKGMTM